jgi:hypothetical protein
MTASEQLETSDCVMLIKTDAVRTCKNHQRRPASDSWLWVFKGEIIPAKIFQVGMNVDFVTLPLYHKHLQW